LNRIFAIAILVVLGFFLFNAIQLDYGHLKPGVSQYYMVHGVRDTGALNIVTSIYLNYRAYDTLGEAAVFFASALGVFMLLRKERGEKKEWTGHQK